MEGIKENLKKKILSKKFSYKVISALFYYTMGNLVSLFIYNKKYLKGKNFNFGGIGWKWVVHNFFFQAILRKNSHVPWPVSHGISIINPENIIFNNDDINNFQTNGSYFQAIGGKIIIGKGCWIAPNVGLICSNHDPYDLNKRAAGKDIILGDHCWLGMNSVILPGVELGEHTIVGAGAIVTKSFPKGNCIIAGNPAKILRTL